MFLSSSISTFNIRVPAETPALTLVLKLSKSAKPSPALGTLVAWVGALGRGGAGRGGGCFDFFGGSAGDGDSGRGGGWDAPGVCSEAPPAENGSHPNGSLLKWDWKGREKRGKYVSPINNWHVISRSRRAGFIRFLSENPWRISIFLLQLTNLNIIEFLHMKYVKKKKTI